MSLSHHHSSALAGIAPRVPNCSSADSLRMCPSGGRHARPGKDQRLGSMHECWAALVGGTNVSTRASVVLPGTNGAGRRVPRRLEPRQRLRSWRSEYWDNLWTASVRVAISGSDASGCEL